MEDLTVLREAREDDAELHPETRHAVRAELLRRIHAHQRRRRDRRIAVALIAAAAVGVVAFLGLAGGGSLPSPAPSVPPAAASDFLHRVANHAEAAPPPPVPRDDQYIYAKELLVETRAGRRVEFVDESWRSVDASRPTRTSERGRSWITRPSDGLWPPNRYADLAALPTEPAELRQAVVERFGGSGADAADPEQALPPLLMLLRGWRIMPPDLRGAIFRTLAEAPEVRVRDRVTDARGRRGIGISAPGVRGFGYEVIVDPSTFEYVGMQSLVDRDDGVTPFQRIALVDAGVVDELGERP